MPEFDYGPAMRQLTEKQRQFVIHWLEEGSTNVGHGSKGYTNAARKAGYSDEYISQAASALWRNEKIQVAIQEEARRRLSGPGLKLAVDAMLDIVSTVGDPQRLNAAKEILSRSGLHSVTETKVTHEFIGDDPDMIEKTILMAKRLGLDPARLLGKRIVHTIDAEFKEVPHDQDETERNDGGAYNPDDLDEIF